MRIFLSAGEASGEQYAVQLIDAIRRREPGADFFGLGGQRMEAIGFARIVRAEDVAVMGITEILRHIPRIYREYRRLKRSLRNPAARPDAAVLIDFPDVNLGLARECKRLGIPVIFFVSPQVWAWKKYRLRQIRRSVDRMLVIFPFEEPFYRKHGVAATFVGHPLTEIPPPEVTREAFAKQHGLDAGRQWIGLLPGSRPREIGLNLPGMLRAAAIMQHDQQQEAPSEFLLPLAPTLTSQQAAQVAAQVAVHLAGFTAAHAGNGTLTAPRITLVRDARATLLHARASIVASGTATVEAALIGNPFLVVYRVSRLTYAIARRVVTVPHVAMVNLVAGRRIVPELIQHDFTAAKVASILRTLLNDEHVRQSMQEELRRVRSLLAGRGLGPIDQVAAATLEAAGASTPAGYAVPVRS
jgi:lipid-A-disaccharide synthase